MPCLRRVHVDVVDAWQSALDGDVLTLLGRVGP